LLGLQLLLNTATRESTQSTEFEIIFRSWVSSSWMNWLNMEDPSVCH